MEVKLHKLYLIILVLAACTNNEKADKTEILTDAKSDVRRAKVEALCSSCHLFVEPDVIDKTTWANYVLPAMGPRFGIFSHKGMNYPTDLGKINTEGLYPSSPAMTEQEWQNILDYFAQYAPEFVAVQQREKMYNPNTNSFYAEPISSNQSAPIITMTKAINNIGLFIYDASSKGLAVMQGKDKLTALQQFENPISDIVPYKNGFLIAQIGSIFPSDEWLGVIKYIELSGNIFIEKEVIRTGVERPVQLTLADLDKDGKDEIIVNGYGNNKGEFYYLKNEGGKWNKKSIKQIPGAIRTQAIDIDKDGDMDILTLFAQATEQLILFKNDGKGNFTETSLLAFSAIQGSTYFEMKDMNNDGILDILYTCGDNADYSVVLKKYHGVYIFLGNKEGAYKQNYFYPMNGAFKAMAHDFDGDGDLDIAAISFFADYINQPYEGFLYFEQKEKMVFDVSAHAESYRGRWLTMDIGDIDKDGGTDIILGNFSMGPSVAPETIKQVWQNGPAAIIYLNTMMRKQ